MKCAVTNRDDVIDDCHIKIEFGYGSDKDMTTYTFSPVHDEVGKKVLNYIDSLIEQEYEDHPILGVSREKKRSVEDFGRDVLEENFNENWWEELSQEEKIKYRAEWGIE